MRESVCVYTALFGGYESLNPQPQAEGSPDRWLCFTDDPDLVSSHWEIVVVEPPFPLDPHRSSRQVKMLGHPLVREHERTLWIDNSVVLHRAPEALLDVWLRSADIALGLHSFRDTVLDEFIAVLDDSLDDPSRVLEQLDHYARSIPDVLDLPPLWGGMIARRWTPEVIGAMEVWWHHLLRYSRRDQLSLVGALAASGVPVERVVLDNLQSEWHRWPVSSDRDVAMRHRTAQQRARPPVADLMLLRRRLDTANDEVRSLEHTIAQISAERDRLAFTLAEAQERTEHLQVAQVGQLAQTAELLSRAQRLEVERAELQAEREVTSAETERLSVECQELRDQLDAIGSSRSWKMARRLSRTAGLYRRSSSMVRSGSGASRTRSE